ncbi:MAG TPA: Tfp pilus assembly protein FimT/FimU [Lysobacter sp.]|nr:Tfp pilus assembly protein FimT/FimU [Lysobacter sp.]
MRQEARGFTLIELMVTLAVMAVLMGVGVPSFQHLQQSARTATAFHLLTTSLALARLSAVKNNVPVSVCPSSDGRYCRGDTVWDDGWIVFADPSRAKQPASAEAVLQRFDRVGPGIALRSTAGRTLVRFHPSGMAQGSNLSVRLCSTKDSTHLGSVIVNNAGRPRSERHDGTPCPFAP